jgi:acyl carrier protein
MPDDLNAQIKDMMVESLMLKIPASDIGDDTPLFGPGGMGWDSIDALELVVGIEKKFAIRVADSETAKKVLVSVNTIRAHIEEKRG